MLRHPQKGTEHLWLLWLQCKREATPRWGIARLQPGGPLRCRVAKRWLRRHQEWVGLPLENKMKQTEKELLSLWSRSRVVLSSSENGEKEFLGRAIPGPASSASAPGPGRPGCLDPSQLQDRAEAASKGERVATGCLSPGRVITCMSMRLPQSVSHCLLIRGLICSHDLKSHLLTCGKGAARHHNRLRSKLTFRCVESQIFPHFQKISL